MSLLVHELRGCRPTPLAGYLKALGVLRLVAQQKDSAARGAWRDEHFVLLTTLSRAELEAFLLNEYRPTPFVSPWNKGAGFFQESDPGLKPLENSTAERFEPFRTGISAARGLLSELGDADAKIRQLKDKAKAGKKASGAEKAQAKTLKDDPEYKRELAAAERRFKTLKEALIPTCRRLWRGAHLDWLDAALVLAADGKPVYPALLGTGGNDGRLDFTNNVMQRLVGLFDVESTEGSPRPDAASLLEIALWETSAPGLMRAAIGQFSPGNAGGANSSAGPDGPSLINPWDFVLMMEGSVSFTSLATRRLGPHNLVQASAPFAVRGHALGSGSTSATEESARGEQWMPLWGRPMTFSEIQHVLAEGRAQIGRKQAERPLDMARAISRLGVARGLSGFQRYAYLERNGQSNLAVPLGRLEVRARQRASLINDLGLWLDRLHRAARKKDAPARLEVAERRLSNAVFLALTREDQPSRWQAVLLAAADIESIQIAGTGIDAGPIPRLSPHWVLALDDGSAELRLALAFGLAAARHTSDGVTTAPIRHHWLPLDKTSRRFATQDRGLAKDPRVVASHRSGMSDCIAVVERRLVEAAQQGERVVPIAAARRASARVEDLGALSRGAVDLDRCVKLARALMALDQKSWARSTIQLGRPRGGSTPDPGWIAVRLALLPWALDDVHDIPADPAIVRRLAGGRAAEAVQLALRRLAATGIRFPFRSAGTNPATGRLWAAALAFPIDRYAARRLLKQVAPEFSEQTESTETSQEINHGP